jgi:hypothetical protein
MVTKTSLPAAPAKADKAVARQIARIGEWLENAGDFIDLMRDSGTKAPFAKELIDLRKRVSAAGEMTDIAQAGKRLDALGKQAKAMLDKAGHASRLEFGQREWRELRAKAAGLLAQALVEVGGLEPPALRAPLQKEQAALKAELDRAEKINDLLKGCAAMEALIPRVEALLKRAGPASVASAWMRASYEPALARARAAMMRVPAERCRKSLLAELDFIEVETNKALIRADMKSIQARVLPTLARLEHLAARIVAVSPALDRELARIAKGVKEGAAPADMIKRLKSLIEVKAAAWPVGATADDIERALTRYEADVAKLAEQARNLHAAALAAKR